MKGKNNFNNLLQLLEIIWALLTTVAIAKLKILKFMLK